MNRKHLDNVDFKKKVTLKEPKYQEPSEIKDPNRNARIFSKVMRLVFFILVVNILWFTSNYMLISLTSFSKGIDYGPSYFHPIQSWKKVGEDYNRSR